MNYSGCCVESFLLLFFEKGRARVFLAFPATADTFLPDFFTPFFNFASALFTADAVFLLTV